MTSGQLKTGYSTRTWWYLRPRQPRRRQRRRSQSSAPCLRDRSSEVALAQYRIKGLSAYNTVSRVGYRKQVCDQRNIDKLADPSNPDYRRLEKSVSKSSTTSSRCQLRRCRSKGQGQRCHQDGSVARCSRDREWRVHDGKHAPRPIVQQRG